MNIKYIYLMSEFVKNLIKLLGLYSLAYLYCLVYAPSIESITDNSISGKINKIHKKCAINCDHNLCSTMIQYRGNNYFISTPQDEQEYIKKCFVTFWGVTHYILYALIGFLLPSMFWESFVCGVFFEIYEHNKYDCADVLDIVLNTAGFYTGYQIHLTYFNNFPYK